MSVIPERYVLLTSEETYFVEYLLNQLILSQSISQAMVFDNYDTAQRFKSMLYVNCQLNCSVNTYIE
jgi:hypothetical protein